MMKMNLSMMVKPRTDLLHSFRMDERKCIEVMGRYPTILALAIHGLIVITVLPVHRETIE